MAPPVLDFWFEFASTYSYPAMMRITSLARDAGIALKFRPFLLGPVFKAQGWETSPFNLYASKGRNMWRDLERLRVSNPTKQVGRRDVHHQQRTWHQQRADFQCPRLAATSDSRQECNAWRALPNIH
jgi:2-hydroxychromene-2-carboxylate isomerase